MFRLCIVDDIFAIDEIADIFGFAGHRLFDDVFIAIISRGGALQLHLYGGVWPQDWKIDPSAD